MSRLKDKPFEILAISLDDAREDAVNAISRRKIPGIHAWDERGWDGNAIARRYNVQDIPTWYLIDPQGVIRARDPFGHRLIPAVEAALTPHPGNKPD